MLSLVQFNSANGKTVTTSLIVADVFGKRHTDVLRDIRNLSCSDDFRQANFALLVEMRQLPQGGATKAQWYEMTKDGFTFLAMGYTGAKASEFKETIIDAFNEDQALLMDDDYIMNRALTLAAERLKALENDYSIDDHSRSTCWGNTQTHQ